MNIMIPTFEYQDKDGNLVKSSSDPDWQYTVINGAVRTVKGGKPQKKVNGKWQDVELRSAHSNRRSTR